MKEVKKCSKGVRRGAVLQTPNRAANILRFCSLDVNILLSLTLLEKQAEMNEWTQEYAPRVQFYSTS